MSGNRTRFAALAVVVACIHLTACSSPPVADDTDVPAPVAADDTPDASPVTKIRNDEARTAPAAPVRTDDRSMSRVLCYVNGEVVNYRDILLRVGPQLAVVGTDDERASLEQRTLFDIQRERIIHRAAVDAGVTVTRDELDKERTRRLRELAKNGGTLEAYLSERGMTHREFDDEVQREIRMQRYMRAAVGLGGGDSVRVRAVTDTYTAPRELRAYYERNPDKFKEPEVARVRVLAIRSDMSMSNRDAALADARRKAESALMRLKAGEDFVPIFREMNRGAAEPDPNDGLLEISERGKFADWIEEFAFKQPRGTYSAVTLTGPTYYVLRAEGYQAARTVPYEEIQGKIQAALGQLKRAVASYEVELSLIEESSITPRERYDELRDFLAGTRKRMIVEAGL
ncbi:MAG: peptidyl-prolyl cis-trans isomerase [Planctomycetes bacterium]|nr:peptidyl-prolyl cis-trans isomerase [Planctomycetota bacterium]